MNRNQPSESENGVGPPKASGQDVLPEWLADTRSVNAGGAETADTDQTQGKPIATWERGTIAAFLIALLILCLFMLRSCNEVRVTKQRLADLPSQAIRAGGRGGRGSGGEAQGRA